MTLIDPSPTEAAASAPMASTGHVALRTISSVTSRRYQPTGTLGPVRLEHSIYGLLLFSLGLGSFLFDGRA